MLWRGLRVRPGLRSLGSRTAIIALALAAGACGASSSVSAGGRGSTASSGAAPPTTSPGAPTTVPAPPAPPRAAAVPVVAAPAEGLQQLRWQRVAEVSGRVVILDYQYGGCSGPPVQATVTQTSAAVDVRLWHRGPSSGEMCADFIRRARASVTLPSAPAGRSITDS